MKKDICSIGVLAPSGVLAIRCGWNGDPYYNGQILVNCWNTTPAAKILVRMGDIITLGPNLEESLFHSRNYGVAWANVAPRKFADIGQWRRLLRAEGCSCFYVFDLSKSTWCFFESNGRMRHELSEFIVNG